MREREKKNERKRIASPPRSASEKKKCEESSTEQESKRSLSNLFSIQMAFSPESKNPPAALLRRSRASAMARLVLCGLVLVNLGVFAGSRLAAWSGKAGGGGGEAAATKSTLPRRALGSGASSSTSSSRLAMLAKLAATDAGPKGVAARRELAHAEPEIWASGGENKSRRDISANVSR